MANINFTGEPAKNHEEKCLCVLVLDTSGSMLEVVDNTNVVRTGRQTTIDGVLYNIVEGGISRLNKLNEGLKQFFEDIQNDDTACEKLEIAIVTFNDTVEVIQSPTLVEDSTAPELTAGGMTDMSGAIETAIDIIDARKAWYRQTKQTYLRPWIVMITDGEPNEGQNMLSLAQIIRQEVANKHFMFMPIGVDNANMEVLNMLSPNGHALPLQSARFSQFFKWLSNSFSTTVQARKGEKIDLTSGLDDWMSDLGSMEV